MKNVVFAKRSIKLAITFVLAAVLIVACAFRICLVNNPPQQKPPVSYSVSEDMPILNSAGSGIYARALNYCVLSKDEAMSAFPDCQSELETLGPDVKTKLLVVRVIFSNKSDSEQIVEPGRLTAQAGAWSNGLDAGLFCRINNVVGMAGRLAAGQSAEMLVPYVASENQFGFNREWGTFENASFNLVTATYPQKTYIQLSNKLAFENYSFSASVKEGGKDETCNFV
ncbi:hypothetical protein [Senegalimassilia anaerobia]